MKRIIILGSSGFVGKSLNDSLNTKYYKIINISRSSQNNFLNVIKLVNSDYIIYCLRDKNIKKSLKLFSHFKLLLKKYSKKTKILFFSSGAVYGPRYKIKRLSEKENISLKNIEKYNGYKKIYAKEKILLEKEFMKLSKEGFKVSIVRGFTFYGRHILNYDYLISKIILAVKSKKTLIINNPNIKRSYMHADDMCRALIKIANISSTKCPVLNLGSDKILDLNKFTKILNKKFNSKILITKHNSKKIDYYVPSLTFVRRYIKLKNTINFYNAITSIIKKK